ncbi:MAG: FxsA family protein [Acidimicrobiales bacterium]
MALLLVLLFFVAPIVELAVIVQVAGSIGVPNTIGLLVAVSIVGAWLAKREGLGVLRRIQAATARGETPSREVADGALILLAGALMIAPGFISDAVALLLLAPPTRAIFRGAVLRAIGKRGGLTVIDGRRARGRSTGADEVWDAESWEDPPRPSARGQLRGPI